MIDLGIFLCVSKRLIPNGKRLFDALLQQRLRLFLHPIYLKQAPYPGHKLRDVVPGQVLTRPGGLTSPLFEQIISYQVP